MSELPSITTQTTLKLRLFYVGTSCLSPGLQSHKMKTVNIPFYFYEPRVAVVLKHCQGCMRVHVCVGFVMGRL